MIKDVTINGNIVTIHNLSEMEMLMEIQKRELKQYVGLGSDLSFPMREIEHREFAVQIHRANNENKLGKKLDIREDGPDTDPTPPGRGGGASVTEFVNTEAKAA